MLSSKNLMKNKKKKGFSLLEIVVSLGLIALFIIPVGNMVLGTVKINKATEDKQQASAVMQEAIEYVKLDESEFPTVFNHRIDIEEKYSVKRTNAENLLGTFSIESLNDNEYGFIIKGNITELEKIKNTVDVTIKENVDGAFYYGGSERGEISVIDKTMNTEVCIEDILSGGNILFNKVVGNKVVINSNNGSNTKVSVEGRSEQFHKYDFNSFLVVLDNLTDTKLNLNITNKHHTKDLIIYLYNKNKRAEASDVDVVINTGGGVKKSVKLVPIYSGLEGAISQATSIYQLDIWAEKHGKRIDETSLTFIK